MSLDLKAFEKIDFETKCLVFGFIRIIEQLLIGNIPTSIYHICTLYFYLNDEWDPKFKTDIKIFNDSSVVCGKRWGTIFLRNVVSSGHNHWKFKINLPYKSQTTHCIVMNKYTNNND